ncbi:MAG: dimethylamine corrinoid protein 3 [Methanomassiliicoccus sp.]|nr:dimethylamine corrinoid protein 3 [Methanomassiliicoccus sp.]
MATKDEIVQKAKLSVLGYNKKGAAEVAKESIMNNIDPLIVIQDGFTPAMAIVGEKYNQGTLFLPHVVAAADAMQAGIAVLVPEIKKKGSSNLMKSKGVVAIGTIEGDVHSIGKDIVAVMLTVDGFDVTNLGKDVPIDSFIKAAKNGAEFIGSSSLMTTSMVNQLKIEEAMREEGLKGKVKTIVGGAPVTQAWADKIGADIYGENSSDAVRKLEAAIINK